MSNELKNRESRLRRAAAKKELVLQKASWQINGKKYTGYQFAVEQNPKLIDGYAGYRSTHPYQFTIEEAEDFVQRYGESLLTLGNSPMPF